MKKEVFYDVAWFQIQIRQYAPLATSIWSMFLTAVPQHHVVPVLKFSSSKLKSFKLHMLRGYWPLLKKNPKSSFFEKAKNQHNFPYCFDITKSFMVFLEYMNFNFRMS